MNIDSLDIQVDNYPPNSGEVALRTVMLGMGDPVFLMNFGLDEDDNAVVNISMSGLGENEDIVDVLGEISGLLAMFVDQYKENNA